MKDRIDEREHPSERCPKKKRKHYQIQKNRKRHLKFPERVKRNRQKRTSKRKDIKNIRTLLYLDLQDVLSITIILIHVFQQLKVRTTVRTCTQSLL